MTKKQTFIIASLFILFASCAAIIQFHHSKNRNLFKINEKKEGRQIIKGTDKIKVLLNMGGSKNFGMEVAVPYEKVAQVQDLWKKHPVIMNDLLVKIPPDKVNEWVAQRDYAKIKIALLSVINSHLDTPIKNLYFLTFFFE